MFGVLEEGEKGLMCCEDRDTTALVGSETSPFVSLFVDFIIKYMKDHRLPPWSKGLIVRFDKEF